MYNFCYMHNMYDNYIFYNIMIDIVVDILFNYL